MGLGGVAGSAFDVGGFQFDSYVFRVIVGSAAVVEIIFDFIFLKVFAIFIFGGPPAQEQSQLQEFIFDAFGLGAPWSRPSRF